MIKKVGIFLFLSLFSSFVFAQSAGDTLSELLKNMHSMQANFTQTIVDKKGHAVQKSTGIMSLQRPSQFRWEIKKPIAQLIVTNGKRLWIYDPELEQVTIRHLTSAAGETPALLLSDENLALTKEFKVTEIKNTDSAASWFLLVPKGNGNVISNIKLAFSNNQIKEMHIQDHLGHTTQIQFSSVKQNIPLPTSLFNFKAPAHVDVIDETQH